MDGQKNNDGAIGPDSTKSDLVRSVRNALELGLFPDERRRTWAHEYYRCTSTQTIAVMLQYLDRLGRSCFLLELVHLDYPSFRRRFCLAMRESLLR